jgi:hypothetical protein
LKYPRQVQCEHPASVGNFLWCMNGDALIPP